MSETTEAETITDSGLVTDPPQLSDSSSADVLKKEESNFTSTSESGDKEGEENTQETETEVPEVASNVKTDLDTSLISKEELRDLECCRLCCIGVLNDNDQTFISPLPRFFQIFDDDESENVQERLDCVINRYLPIEVFDSDPYYPRVICSVCYDSLQATVQFFNKICEGQRLLSKIRNNYSNLQSPSVMDEPLPNLLFSQNNPVVKASKRRGRPRKDPTKIKESKKKPKEELPEILEPRTKRQSRPPVRYIDESMNVTKEEVSDNVKEEKSETLVGNSEINGDGFASFRSEFSEANPLSSGTNENQLDFRIATSSLDVCKKGVNLESLEMGLEEAHNSSILVDPLGTEKNDAYIVYQPRDEEEDEKSDNDRSVKLSDLVGKRKKATKGKRKNKRKTIRKNVTKIQCDKCPKTFNHSSSLMYHRQSAHDKMKKFSCNICGRAFAHKQLLSNHMYVHSDEKGFPCDKCHSKFKSRASLYTHKKSKHSAVKEFTCDKCGFQFNLKSSLKAHMRLHTGEKPFKCEFCQKTFAQRSNLREHRRTHTGERPYVCVECQKSFTTASQLRSHKFCHVEQKAHLCPTCGKRFSHTENFKYHMRRHSGERPLECKVCKKRFAEPWSLKKHLRLHTGEKPYQCTEVQCNKVFADPSNFAKHKKIHLPSTITSSDSKARDMEPSEISVEIKQQADDNAAIITESGLKHHRISGSSIYSPSSIVASGSDGILGGLVSDVGTENSEQDTSIVHLVSSDGVTYSNVGHDDQEQVEQVIYVYSGDGPLFTFMSDSQQSSEAGGRISDETNGGLSSVSSLNGAFNSGEFESHYYSLETIDGNTVAVPIPMPHSSGHLAVEVDGLASLKS